VFGRKTCKWCKPALGKVEHFVNHRQVPAQVTYYDIDLPEGMAEGAWYDVVETPTIVLEEGETIIRRWLKIPPRLEELAELFNLPGRPAREVAPEAEAAH
jgi:hypothetical protein